MGRLWSAFHAQMLASSQPGRHTALSPPPGLIWDQLSAPRLLRLFWELSARSAQLLPTFGGLCTDVRSCCRLLLPCPSAKMCTLTSIRAVGRGSSGAPKCCVQCPSSCWRDSTWSPLKVLYAHSGFLQGCIGSDNVHVCLHLCVSACVRCSFRGPGVKPATFLSHTKGSKALKFGSYLVV